MWRLFWICLMVAALTSCGFHPRGNIPLAPPLHNMYLKTADPYGQLARNLKQHLKLSCVHLTTCCRNATTVLEILSEETGQQLLSVSGSQQTRQYNLTLTVTFQVTDPHGIVLVPPQTVSESRTIPIQSNQILGGSNEANILYNQMRFAIVNNIMNRLSSQDVTYLLMCCHS